MSTLQRISVSPCSTYTSPVKVAILSFSRSSSDAARIFTGSSRSGCRLFVGFGFPDDWRLIVPLLILFVLFVFFVIVVVGVSRRHRVIHDGGKPPVGQDKNVVRHARVEQPPLSGPGGMLQ